MHVLAGINYNHQAPDKAAKLARRFSCLKRRVAPTPPALAHSTYENRRAIPGLVKQGINTTYDPTRSSLMFSTIDVMVAQAHIDQLNELADAKHLVKADRH